MATVAAGLYVSWNGPLLIPAATRLQGMLSIPLSTASGTPFPIACGDTLREITTRLALSSLVTAS